MDVRIVLESVMSKLQYDYSIDERISNNEYTLIRAHISSAREANAFIAEVEKATSSTFRHFYERSKPARIIYRKKWICQHSSYRKGKNSKKNANCKVFIDVFIKIVTDTTKRRDPYLKLPKPLQCIIKLNLNHTHSNNTPDMLRMLRVGSEVKKQFQDYFNSGMRVAEARRLHESKVLVNGGDALLENASCNPTQSQQYELYQKWKGEKSYLSCEPFKKLLEKLPTYESEGITVKYHRMHPWSVLVVTPVMKRAQSLLSSQEVIFVTSTSDCDHLNYTFTVLLTATKVGAVPIAVMFHQNQSTDGYQSAFTLLMKTFPSCFGGKEGPDVFITDDLLPEKDAIRIVWQSSKQLLSPYHVRHVEWRWLLSKDSDIEMSDCKDVMKLFEAVMYSEDEMKMQQARGNILMLFDKFPAFVTRFENFFKRKEEWVFCYRSSYISQNANMWDFCEATIRILKDVILNRTKSLKIIALVEFCITVFEVYLSKKLLDCAHNQVSQHDILYNILSSKMTGKSEADVQQIDEETYLVPSSTKKNHMYIVEAKSGYCTCHSSKTGTFCKHQCFLRGQSKLKLPDAPVMTSTDQFIFKKLALRDKYPEDHFNLDFITKKETNTGDSQYVKHCESTMEIDKGFDFIQHKQFLSDVKLATVEEKSSLLNEINRLLKFNIDSAKLKRLKVCLSKIRNSSQLNETLDYINSMVSEMPNK